MRKLTIANLSVSIFAWSLFLFNQLCNLRFLALWTAWNLSAYAFMLLVAPVSLILSLVCIATDRSAQQASSNKNLTVNVICASVTALLLIVGHLIPGVYTWA